MHLPSSDVLLVLRTSQHLCGYLRKHAAQLMDKHVNTRSIWAERPHKPHLIPFLKYEKRPQSQAGEKELEVTWHVNDGSHSRLNQYVNKGEKRSLKRLLNSIESYLNSSGKYFQPKFLFLSCDSEKCGHEQNENSESLLLGTNCKYLTA